MRRERRFDRSQKSTIWKWWDRLSSEPRPGAKSKDQLQASAPGVSPAHHSAITRLACHHSDERHSVWRLKAAPRSSNRRRLGFPGPKLFCGTQYSPETKYPHARSAFSKGASVMTPDAPVRCDKSRPGPATLRQEPSAGTKSGLRQGPSPPGSEQLKIMDRGQDHRTAFRTCQCFSTTTLALLSDRGQQLGCGRLAREYCSLGS